MIGRLLCGIEVPPGPEGLELLQTCQALLAERAGFDGRRGEELRLALEEAVTFAVRPGAVETYRVAFRRVPLGLEVSLHEEGEPYEAVCPEHLTPEALLAGAGEGLGFLLLRGVTDETSFDDEGPGGRTLRYVKYFSTPSAAEAPAPTEPPAPPVDPAEVVYRPMDPREAVEVSRCAWRSYGNSYPNPHLYYPDRVRALNEAGKVVSLVAAAGDQVLGHAALEVHDPRDGSCELGMAFVKPPYRGLGLLKGLTDRLLEEGTRRGFRGFFVQSVTVHPASQKAARAGGFVECALLPGAYPGSMDFKALGGTPEQRLSLMVQYLPRGTRRERTLYLPERHRDFLGEVYEALGLPFREASVEGSPPEGPGLVGADYSEILALGTLEVDSVGRGTLSVLGKRLREFRLRKAGAVTLRLPLEDPGTPTLAAGLESLGCFPVGVLPDEVRGDRLLMQRVFEGPLDYEKVTTASPWGRRLLERVRSNDPEA